MAKGDRKRGDTGKERGRDDPARDVLDEVLDGPALNPALSSVYGEMGVDPDGAGAKVFITKILHDGKEARVWQGAPDDYDLMDVSRKHGSGDYRVKVYVTISTGQSVPAPGANKIFTIQLTPAEDALIKQARENPQPALQNAAAPGALSADQIRQMIIDGVRAAIPAKAEPAINPLELVRTFGEIMKAAQPQSAPAFPVGEVLRLVLGVVKDVGAQRSGDDDDRRPRSGKNVYDIWDRVVEKAIPLLEVVALGGAARLPAGSGAGAAPGMPTAGAPHLTVVPGGPPAAPAPVETVEFTGTPEELAAMNAMKQGIAYLVAQADAGHDPVTYADVVQDNVPEESLRALIAQPDVIAYLAAIDPRVIQTDERRKWFTELFNTIKEDLTDDGPAA